MGAAADRRMWSTELPEFAEMAEAMFTRISEAGKAFEVRNLTPDLYGYLQSKMGRETDERANGYYHPSEIGGCLFAAAHSRLKTPIMNRRPPEKQMILDHGTAIHWLMGRYCRNMYGGEDANKQFLLDTFGVVEDTVEQVAEKLGRPKFEVGAEAMAAAEVYSVAHETVLFLAEVPMYMEALLLGGTADGLIYYPNGSRVLPDFKSIKSAGKLRKASDRYIMQLHCYLMLSETGLGSIWYFDKSASRPVDFPLRFDVNKAAAVVNRVASSENAIRLGRMPEPLPNFWCNECGYNHLCPMYPTPPAREGLVGSFAGKR